MEEGVTGRADRSGIGLPKREDSTASYTLNPKPQQELEQFISAARRLLSAVCLQGRLPPPDLRVCNIWIILKIMDRIWV